MKLKDIAKNLANRINQEHYLESELKKIYLKGFENGVKTLEAKNNIMKTAIEQLASEVLTLDYLTIDQCARLINVIAKYHDVESEQLKIK